jgi:hypothetical protein
MSCDCSFGWCEYVYCQHLRVRWWSGGERELHTVWTRSHVVVLSVQLCYTSFHAYPIAEQLKFTFPFSDLLTYVNLCRTCLFENKLNSFNTFLSSFFPVVIWRFLGSAHAEQGEGDRSIAPLK